MRSLLGTRAQSYHEVPHQTNAMLPPMPPPRPVPSAWTSPPPAPSAWISSQLLTTAPGQARPRAPSASKLQHQSQDELFKSYNTETHRSPAPSLAQSKRKPTKLNKPEAQGSDNRASSPNSSHNKPDPHTESSIPIEFKPASPEEQVSQQTTNKVSHTGHDDPHRRKSGSLSHLKKSSEQMRAVFKDTEDIGTRKRNTGELLREAEKLKMADNCTDCRDSNCSDATQTPLSQQKALPATSTPTAKTGATELPPISPVSLSRHSSYQGWILRKAEPLPGELTSWARIEKNSMPFSQEALARTVKIRNTRTPVMQEYDELPYENLRTQVDRLVTDCQLIEKDPNVKWSLASIEPVAVQHPKYRRPEIVIMHVILESSSGGKASEHASSNSTPTLSEGEDDVRLDKQLALPETSRPSNFSEISSVVDLSTPLVLPGRSALRMGRPPSVGSSTYVGSDSDTDQKHENALEHEGFAEQNGLLGQSKEVDAWLASFDRDDDLVADKELMARLPNLYKTHLRQKNAEKLMQGLMEEGKTQDDLAKAFEDELVKRRSSGLSEPANVENDSAADLSEKEDKLDAQGHPETEKQTGMAEKTPEYLTAGKPTKTETQRINREEQKPQNNSRAADKLVAGEMTSDTSVSSSALTTEGGLPLEQRDHSSNRNGTSFKTRKMKRKNLKGLQFPKGLPRIDDNITAIEKVEPKQGGSLLMTSQEKQSRKQSEIKFAKVVCYLWLMRKWPYVPSQKRYHVKHWPGRGADDTQANVMQDVGKPVVDQNINKKLVGQQKPHPKKLVKLRWICTCGQLFEEVMEELVAGAVQELASELSTPDCSDIGLSTLSSSTSSLPETNPSSFDSSAKSRKPYSGPDDLAIDIDGSTDAESSQFPRVQKYILLCLASKGQENLEHADMSSAKTDRCMYSEFHRRYFTPMRRLVRLLTLRTLDRIEFTRFQLFNKASVAIESGDIGALPPNTARDYEYERKHPYRPLIPLTALKHWTENPSHARSRPLHINRVPTKISGQLRWSEDDGGELEGWGLRFKETMSWRAVWVSEFLIAGTATAFAVFWCAYRNGDIQDGFTVAGVVLAYGTIFLGLVQGFAQYLEQSS
ncbi:MAG: hypothetical protein M1821_009984 [Bathelium mastoideum]|nr:MAG: hypothetical protein M1821_009984 [Bathelium mastoideum]